MATKYASVALFERTAVTTMSSTLQSAMELHKNGELEEAAKKYKELVGSNTKDKRVYVNYAAILRKEGKPNECTIT